VKITGIRLQLCHFHLPETPGLGIELDEDTVAAHAQEA